MIAELPIGYNAQVVFLTTGLLGAAAGAIGCFLILRKRALLSDTISHATLPGIALAFMVMVALGYDGRGLISLLAGATIFGLIGAMATVAIRKTRRLREDAALAITLSVFFGLGIVLLSFIQQIPSVNSAGLKSFIYGRTASLTLGDLQLVAGVSALTFATILLFHRPLTALCFDERYAVTSGLPVSVVDFLLMTLIVLVVIAGLQSVGLLLIVSLLIIPAVTARFWTDSLPTMILLAAIVGAVSCLLGSILSALAERMPAGAIIVLVASGFCLLSILLGTRQGLLREKVAHWQAAKVRERDHLLRYLVERNEETVLPEPTIDDLAMELQRPRLSVRRLCRRLEKREELDLLLDGRIRLSAAGEKEARRLVRNHRLWELYLIHHADTAPAFVDRSADRIEHILDAALVSKLEALLAQDELHPIENPHP